MTEEKEEGKESSRLRVEFLLRVVMQETGSPFLIESSLIEELDNLIVDLAEGEQDSIFKALIDDIVFANEEVLGVAKDDFFI